MDLFLKKIKFWCSSGTVKVGMLLKPRSGTDLWHSIFEQDPASGGCTVARRRSKTSENQWKSSKINENQWKSMKINEIQWKSVKVHSTTSGSCIYAWSTRVDHAFMHDPLVVRTSNRASLGIISAKTAFLAHSSTLFNQKQPFWRLFLVEKMNGRCEEWPNSREKYIWR